MHVYRDGKVKRIDEGRGIFRSKEEEIDVNGKKKKVKVWRFTDGGRPVNHDSLKVDMAIVKSIFD